MSENEDKKIDEKEIGERKWWDRMKREKVMKRIWWRGESDYEITQKENSDER